MGDEVKVRVIKVDVDNREIHFELTDSDNGEENPAAGLQVSKDAIENLSEKYEILSVEEFENKFDAADGSFIFDEDIEEEEDLEEVDAYKEDYSQYLDEEDM